MSGKFLIDLTLLKFVTNSFVEAKDRVLESDYIPSDADIVHLRKRTEFVNDIEYTHEGNKIR